MQKERNTCSFALADFHAVLPRLFQTDRFISSKTFGTRSKNSRCSPFSFSELPSFCSL